MEKNLITQETFDNHDCHKTEDDGCEVCEYVAENPPCDYGVYGCAFDNSCTTHALEVDDSIEKML